uniref:Protein kinase domain-containing protein n=1 Tax=Oryza punctata TaxID=4537 RepID=A0A0E0KUN8_ORYPU
MRHAPLHATTENSKGRIGARQGMPCRRASSTPVATAAAALAAPALALGLALLAATPHGVLSQGLALPPLPNQPPPINLTCDEIAYPFGLRGKYAGPGFQVTCGPNNEAMLPIGEHSFRIDQVSLQEGFVVIFAGPISQQCYDRNGRPAAGSTGIGRLNLTGTPFFFSKRNMLVATGCYSSFLATFTSSLRNQSSSATGGCETQCSVNSDGLCPGTDCCKIDMPTDGAQEFTFNFNNKSASVTGEEAGNCSAAFILDQEEQIVINVSGDGRRMPFGEQRMVLDWVIGRTTCEQVRSNNYKPQYYCNNVSSCIDASSGAGYFCRCKAGYEQYNGSPYEAGGCQVTPNNADDLTKSIYSLSHAGPRPPTQNLPQGVGLALTVTLATTLLCYYWTMKKRKVARKRAELFRKNGGLLLHQRFSMIPSQGEEPSAKIFSAEELKNATDNYSESRILGRGGNGTVYKGILPNKTTIAIKKSILFDESQVEQFVNEITILSQIDHPNVVKLLGCCLETKVPLLVYEFIPNGTLFQHIHNKRTLTWEDCLRIAEETAGALAYLHSTSSTPIIHRDIKSSNILLDENFVAKISDFGASRSVPSDHTHVTTLIQGTIGYLDPEYFQTSQLTEKSDVYSFGVVLAELLTRQKPISVGRPEESCNLSMYIVILLNERRLLQEIEPQILVEAGEEQIYAVAELSVRCLNVKGEERPAMREVASVLHRLRESFDEERIIRRSDESIQIINEQESVHSEARPISSLQSSEETTTQYSLPSDILASSHLAR